MYLSILAPRLFTFFVLVFVFFTVLLSVSCTPLHAQTRVEWSGASLKLSPPYPEPHTNVTVTIDAYTYDMAGASIVWRVDGKVVEELTNERVITLPVGDMGEETVVSATIVQIGGSSFTLRKDIVPTTLDVIVEANTYVPVFYRGRALGSAKSELRAIAVVQNGARLDPRNLTYTWEHNGAVLFGGPVRGKDSVTFAMPEYSGGYVSVGVGREVTNSDGKRVFDLIAEKRIALTAVKPELHFYEENLLRGLNEAALTDKFALIGEETTIYGEPFYFTQSIGSDQLDFEWSINDEKTINENLDPHSITLKKTGGAGSALVALRVLTKELIPHALQGMFTISF